MNPRNVTMRHVITDMDMTRVVAQSRTAHPDEVWEAQALAMGDDGPLDAYAIVDRVEASDEVLARLGLQRMER